MSDKPHKFFEKFLDNDLNKLSDFLTETYSKIEKQEIKGISKIDDKDYWLQSQSTSTIKWREYNVFQFYNQEIYKLYSAVRELTKEACDYYNLNYNEQQYMIQGWFNVNYTKKGKLDWHDHGPNGAPNFHGYYCVKAEPSITHYLINGKEKVDNINIDNRVILSEMTHPHAMADWNWDGPRITIAYDVIPLKDLIDNNLANEQHWFPL